MSRLCCSKDGNNVIILAAANGINDADVVLTTTSNDSFQLYMNIILNMETKQINTCNVNGNSKLRLCYSDDIPINSI